MNTTHDDGGPAFPVPPDQSCTTGDPRDGMAVCAAGTGMSLRDWFAKEGARIHAEGLIALGFQPSSVWDEICREGLRFADAMLAARKEGA